MGIIATILDHHIKYINAEATTHITPTNVTSRYNRDFEEDIGVVASDVGDFFIIRNTSLETYIGNNIGNYCEVDYGTRHFSRYKIIEAARCE